MTRAKRRQELIEYFADRAPISRTLGMRLEFLDGDRPCVTMPYNPAFDHGFQGIHGGVYALLLDTAGWFASAVSRSDAPWIATSEMSIHFLKASSRTDLRAEARIVKKGRRQDIVEMSLHDGSGELVGHAMGTFIVLPHMSMEAGGEP